MNAKMGGQMMSRNSAIYFAVITMLLLGLFFGCSGKRGEIKIGALLPLTGDIKDYGELVKNGMDFAVDEINNGDGVDGDNLKIVYADSQGTPEAATKVVFDLINKEKVPVIIGGVSSSVSLAVAPICENNKVVLLSPASSSPKLTGIGEYFFRIYPSDTLEGFTMANRIINYQYKNGKQYFDKVVVVASKTDYAEGVKIEFVKEYRRRKGETLDVINYDPANPEFSDVINRIKASIRGKGGVAIYIAGYYADTADFLLALRAAPWFDPQAIKVFASAGAYTPDFRTKAAPFFVPKGLNKYSLVFPLICNIRPDSPEPLISNFAKKFYAKYKTYPDSFAAHGYDAVKLIAEVIARRGTMPRDIQYGISMTKDWPGASGMITFDENHDVTKYPIVYAYDGKDLFLFDPDYINNRPGYYNVEIWK
jgi:branched-chain amino acid transport system substrate-binding protein